MCRAASRFFPVVSVILSFGALRAAEPATELAAKLRDLNANVIPADSDRAKELPKMLSADARSVIRAANQHETAAWRELKSKADWEKYRDPRVAALRSSLGQPIDLPKDLKLRVTRTLEGEGYKIENVIFESRPGLIVTANLYSPAKPAASMPGFVICPSHHNPKTQSELQDMGMTWARLGAMVIVPDNLGHGERRQHTFVNAESYPGTFRVSRQDYYFRYNTALQLHLVGESLVGWIAGDLSRCVDVLLSKPGIDKDRIILLGSVAGGGDPAAVAAALDPRIGCVVPFNFGGPQPETIFPLPADVENAFNYAGGGSWESTRNLRLSARDGFMPWVIVGSVAPRPVIHAHEFAWDKDRDPVWARYQKIFAWYNAADKLASSKGRGAVTGKPPEATHCNNIGPEHRKELYPALNRWFKMEATPDKEYKVRRDGQELLCLTKEASAAVQMRPAYELAAALAIERLAAARKGYAALSAEARLKKLQQDWGKLLGDVEPAKKAEVQALSVEKLGQVAVERVVLKTDVNVDVPLVLLRPQKTDGKAPVVVGFAQGGKQEFLKQRAGAIAELLQNGVAVCLVDLRGTGETRPGDGRSRTSAATSISATELMAGRTLLGLRLRDLRTVLVHLRSRADVDAGRIALWGDSFAPPNADGVRLDVPWDADKLPAQAEPLGGLLALLAGLYEPDVRAIYGNGGLAGYQSVLQSYFCYVPHDAIVPGALTVGDLGDVAAALAPRPVCLDGLVDGVNCRVSGAALAKAFDVTQTAYQDAKAKDRLTIGGDVKPAAWLAAQLRAK